MKAKSIVFTYSKSSFRCWKPYINGINNSKFNSVSKFWLNNKKIENNNMNQTIKEPIPSLYWLEPVVTSYVKPISTLNDLPCSSHMNGVELKHGDRVLILDFVGNPIIVQYVSINTPHWKIVQEKVESNSKMLILDELSNLHERIFK